MIIGDPDPLSLHPLSSRTRQGQTGVPDTSRAPCQRHASLTSDSRSRPAQCPSTRQLSTRESERKFQPPASPLPRSASPAPRVSQTDDRDGPIRNFARRQLHKRFWTRTVYGYSEVPGSDLREATLTAAGTRTLTYQGPRVLLDQSYSTPTAAPQYVLIVTDVSVRSHLGFANSPPSQQVCT